MPEIRHSPTDITTVIDGGFPRGTEKSETSVTSKIARQWLDTFNYQMPYDPKDLVSIWSRLNQDLNLPTSERMLEAYKQAKEDEKMLSEKPGSIPGQG